MQNSERPPQAEVRPIGFDAKSCAVARAYARSVKLATAVAVVAFVMGIYWSSLEGVFARDHASAIPSGVTIALFLLLAAIGSRQLASTAPSPAPAGLAGLAVCGAAWMLGQLLLVQALAVAAVVGMAAMSVLAVLGYRYFRVLALPLGILLFLVPIWDSLASELASTTADVIIAGLRASGIPVHREGVVFAIPTGQWRVDDSCSGIKYFVTMFASAIVYGALAYRTARKRLVFIAGALVLAVVCNWLRAYLTVLIAHLSDNRFLRDDHATFGWLLYGTVMLAYAALGARFQDGASRPIDSQALAGEKLESGKLVFAAITATLLLLAWPWAYKALARSENAGVSDIVDIAATHGWAIAVRDRPSWTPQLRNPSLERTSSFEKDGEAVHVYTAVYQNQNWSSKLVTSANRLVNEDNRDWSLAARGSGSATLGNRPLQVKTAVVVGEGGVRVTAWHWYFVNRVATGSDLDARWRQLLAKLSAGRDVSVWVAVYTVGATGGDSALLSRFLAEMGDSLDASLRATVTSR